MANTDVVMPQMGESITEGTLTKWHKKLGDKVEREEILFEISTDKVDSEIPSPKAGYLAKIIAPEGSVVPVNSVVAVLSDDAPLGQSTTVAAAQSSTSSVAPAVKSSVATQSSGTAPKPESTAAVDEKRRQLSSPLVRKMAAEHNVDVSQLQGTGDSGRVTKQDLLNAITSGNLPKVVSDAAVRATSPTKTATAAELGSMGGSVAGTVDGMRIERIAMTTMRKKIADHMVMSKRTSPHVTSIIEIDVQKISDLRNKAKDKFEALHGYKLSFMPFFMHAALEGLRAVPMINSSVESDTILLKKDVNLGVAVAIDSGLIVPVIKNAAERNVIGLGKELNNLAEKARNKKLLPDDVKGGSFSISNYGGFGTLIGQPIINQPQVAIMGIGAMTKKPVVINDAIAIRTMVYVVLTFDHRVLDGADSGKFLSTVKNTLENWTTPIL